jgi:ubiquinone/menaquinone biosynthesis C-methylase UbiE
LTELEGIAEHFPRRVSSATRPKDPAAPASTQAEPPAGERPVETAGAAEPPQVAAEQVETARVEGVAVEAADAGAPAVEVARAEGAAVEEADAGAPPVEVARDEGVAVEAADAGAPRVEVARVEGVAVEAADAGTPPVEAARVEGVAVEAADAGTSQVEPVEAAPVEPVEASQGEPVEASQGEPSQVEPASIEPSDGATDALPRVLVASSQDAEDTRALQTTLDGEGQRSFIARARVLGANAWRAVELGTGLGDIAIALARALPGLHLMAIDPSAAMLRLARRKQWMMNTNVTFIHGDAQATGLSGSSCDLVLAHGVMHLSRDPAALLSEVARIASDNAAIYICDLQRPETPEALERALADQAEDWSERQRRRLADAMRASLRLDEVRALCVAAGLTDVEVRASGEHRWEVVRARRL